MTYSSGVEAPVVRTYWKKDALSDNSTVWFVTVLTRTVDISLVDKDGDGEISDPADYDYIGSAQPKLTYGITNSFRYKNFDLSFFLRGTIGNDILNATRMAYAQSGFLPGTNALDDPLTYTLSETPRFSNYYLEKGSFMRLDNLTLGYKIKALNGIRVYFTAQNLFVITKYKGLDPEVPMDSGRRFNPGCRTS